MKKTNLFPLLFAGFLLAGASCSFEPSVPENEFLIKGTLTNLPDSIVIELRIDDGQLLKEISRDTVINGEFTLHDTITGGARQLLLMSSSQGFPGAWANVWVAPGKQVEISGSDKLLPLWTIKSDLPEQAAENLFVESTLPEQKECLALKAEEHDFIREWYKVGDDNEALGKACWVKIDSIRKLEEPLQEVINKKELQYLKKAPVTPVWMRKYLSHATRLQWDKKCSYIPEIKELYTRMSDADRETELGQTISEYLNLGSEVNVGDDMVDGDLYDLDGNLHHLAEYKGRYILLDFWSQGCGPCIQSIPEMEEIAEMYKDKIAVVSISGDSKESWKTFVAKKKMTGIQWNELRKGRTGLAARYKAIGIPHYVLISPDGKIQDIWSGYGPGNLKAKLKKL